MVIFFLKESNPPPRRKTFSAGSVPDEFSSDTLKRRRKFSWVKSNFMRRKSEKKTMSGSQTDLKLLGSDSSGNSESVNIPCSLDPLRKSVSLELLPTITGSDESFLSIKPEGNTSADHFQGYLR